MIKKKEIIKLPEGSFNVETMSFDSTDDKYLKELYYEWRELSKKLQSLGGRGVNLPEVLSEAIFCRITGAVRINSRISKVKSSFDCYDLISNKRIQVKACSVLPDLTSFGPKSVWDELYFMDFYNEGNWDGSIKVYLIPNEAIYNHKTNVNQSMKQQQEQGKRPRFSIQKQIIEATKLTPIYTYKLACDE
jgi:hypothetical protein